MESGVHAVPMRVGKKMRKRRELDALVGGGGSRGGRLLSASSDEGETWGRRTARRRRSRPLVRLVAGLALCACVVSAATVLWLFVDVRRQIVSLRNEMDRVSTSSSSVGDALQICHTAAKELRTNATDLSARLMQLELEHQVLAKRMEQATVELASVSEQLSAAPKLADTPRRLAELQRTVADFGSQLKGFDSSLANAKSQALTATSQVEEIKALFHQLEGRTNDTIANITASAKREGDLKEELATLNTTLVERLNGLQEKILEINKPSSSTSSTTTTTSTTAAPPPAAPALVTPSPANDGVKQAVTS